MKNLFNTSQITINIQFSKMLQERLKLPKDGISIQLPESITTLTQFIEYVKKPSHLRRFKASYLRAEKARCLEYCKWLFEDYKPSEIEINDDKLQDFISSNASEILPSIITGETLIIDLPNPSMRWNAIHQRKFAEEEYIESIKKIPCRLFTFTLMGTLLGAIVTCRLPNDIIKAQIIGLHASFAGAYGMSILITSIICFPTHSSRGHFSCGVDNSKYRPSHSSTLPSC